MTRIPQPGDRVKVIEKKNYPTGKLTEGVVRDVLTKSETHPRGHKVRLTCGIIGRVQEYLDKKDPPKENGVRKTIGPHELI